MGCLNQQALIADPKGCSIQTSKSALACMVNSEIGAVLSVMRRNVRWGVHYSEEEQLEHPLIYSFKELRKKIFSWAQPWHTLDPSNYLTPFLDVIQSDDTSAPITGVALSSVYKILTLDIINLHTVNVNNALNLIVDAVTSCRFEVTDPASEEVALMKILQVLLACVKNKASINLSNHHVCNIVNTCFRIVHQASSKGELLQRIARHTMHELVRCIFSHLLEIDENTETVIQEGQNGNLATESSVNGDTSNEKEVDPMNEPYGIPCMVEIFQFLCSLLNVMEHTEIGPRSNPIAYDEDVPLFALGLINSAMELGGPAFHNHPKLLSIIQNELFHNLMRFGMSLSPLILSTVCSIVLNLYHWLRNKLKLQIEAFISGVLLKIAKSKGVSYQLQEVAMEALVDFCRQNMFMSEMYANFDCDISCNNVFEDITNLLSKSAFPVNNPLSAINTLALDGLIAMILGVSERIGHDSSGVESSTQEIKEYTPFWTEKCEDYKNPEKWVPHVNKMKGFKKKLSIGADHFNREPKKGFEFLQGIKLLPEKLDSKSVACFLRYTAGLDKNFIGDYLGSHDEFCIEVLNEFAKTFDFEKTNLDTALRIFLETFRLPGESQKIQRVLEAFAERYYDQSPDILVNKDAALLLSYSIIMLNTDQHNAQVKKKMTEEDFVRNNRRINGGNDLPREFLSHLFKSICENEIKMTPDGPNGPIGPTMSPSNWIGLVHRSKQATPFIMFESGSNGSHLDYNMFNILSGPTIAALSVVFDNVEQEHVMDTCINGYLAIAKISCAFNFDEILDDLIISLCKFTTLLRPSFSDEFVLTFGDDYKAKLATEAVFTIANSYGDHIRSGWKNILDCILSLQKLKLLPPRFANESESEVKTVAKDNTVANSSPSASNIPSSRRSNSLMGRFSQLLYFDTEEQVITPSIEDVQARKRALETIQKCRIDNIFADSKFLQAESLLNLVRALVYPKKGPEDEESCVFFLELLITITLNNRDRIMFLWESVYEHIANIVQTTIMPCALVEKAVFGLLRICQRLLPYKENLTDELLKSLQLILKLDARVADAYCENITQEVMHLVKANVIQIRSHMGWRIIISLLSITARHPEASETGYETLSFIMESGAHLLPANYVFCVNAARQFAESRVGLIERSIKSLDLMCGSIYCLIKWFSKSKEGKVGPEALIKMSQDIWEMWLRLVQGLRKLCLDSREEVRNHAILCLEKCLINVNELNIPNDLWLQCFDLVIFTLIDDLFEITEQNNRNIEGSLILTVKLMSKVFLQCVNELEKLPSFCKMWLKVLACYEKYSKVKFRGKKSEKINELVPELLKNTLLVMKSKGILVQNDAVGSDSFWQLTWLHVKNISPGLESEVFPQVKSNCTEGNVLGTSSEKTGLEV